MKTNYYLTDKAKEALTITLNDGNTFVPDKLSVDGNTKEGYTVELANKSKARFSLLKGFETVNSIQVANIVDDVNNHGKPTLYLSKIDNRLFGNNLKHAV